jgi:predicted nucleic acid-binding protein
MGGRASQGNDRGVSVKAAALPGYRRRATNHRIAQKWGRVMRQTAGSASGKRTVPVPHKRLYRRVFHLYASLPLDYVDAYHAALVEQRGARTVLSYDRHFDQVPGLERRKP